MGTSIVDWRRAGAFFEHRGHRIIWREEGASDAPVLLLIHGFPTASWDWEALWPGLTQRYRVLTFDMIGFGFSDKPLGYNYSILDQADIGEALLRERGVDRHHVLAHDYGDSVAQELLARSVEPGDRPTLQSVCFLNGGLFPETHRPVLIQKLLLSRVGPLVARRQQDRVRGYIETGQAEGARLVLGGTAMPDGLDRGWYVQPTLFADADNSMRVAREEIFGPVLTVIPYADEDDAVNIANDSQYGLAGSVFTADNERGLAIAARIRTGTFGVNQGYTMDPFAPFGGVKGSGYGRELGREGIDGYTETKSIAVALPPKVNQRAGRPRIR